MTKKRKDNTESIHIVIDEAKLKRVMKMQKTFVDNTMDELHKLGIDDNSTPQDIDEAFKKLFGNK